MASRATSKAGFGRSRLKTIVTGFAIAVALIAASVIIGPSLKASGTVVFIYAAIATWIIGTAAIFIILRNMAGQLERKGASARAAGRG